MRVWLKGFSVEELDDFEDGLIGQFRQHPVLVNLDLLSPADFADILLQRRFLSIAFTPAYDLAIDLLEDEKGLEIARVILREEYPGSEGYTRSHREDMKEDLLRLGVSRKDLVATRPTAATIQSITDTFTLISDAATGEHPDVRLLTFLRFWGEVIVSVEYGELWRRMAQRLNSDQSSFYYPHYIHDAKRHPLVASSPLATTHSDQLGMRLWEILKTEKEGESFKSVESEVLNLKLRFYDQFSMKLEGAEAMVAQPQ